MRFAKILYELCFPKNANNDGGPSSGNFGHEGRPGEIGGAAPKGSADSSKSLENGVRSGDESSINKLNEYMEEYFYMA